MNYLPFEILQEIFSQLHQRDKVECLTVCRAWRRVLEETTLFQVVHIRSNTQMHKLITRMDQKPNQRQKVKQPILDQRTYDYGDISDPLSLFSNIEEITVHSRANMIIDRPTDFPSILAWSKTIKRINEEYSHSVGDINPAIIPTNITPTGYITKLCVETTETFSTEEYIALLTYLAKKYTRTCEIVYSIDLDRWADFEECMTQGLVPHLQQVAPFLTSLKVPTSRCFQYVFPTLYQNNCQLKEFACCEPTNRDEMNQIVYSSQAQSIQKFAIHLSESSILIDHLSKLETLTELNITSRTLGVFGYYCSIYMNNLLGSS